MKLLKETGPLNEATDFDELGAEYITEWRAVDSPATTQRRLASYRAFASFVRIDIPQLANYKAPRNGKKLPHPIPGGIATILMMIGAAQDDRERALVALCGLGGLRIGEALTVELADLDLVSMRLKVHGKGSKDRTIPLSQHCLQFIQPAINRVTLTHGPLVGLHDRTARTAVKRLAMTVGVAAASHDLRAAFATAAYERTHDLRAVQELLGHSSSTTTEVYTLVDEKAMRAAADVV